MVIDHLQAHPAEALTATKISRVIEKSSEAANGLAVLTKQGNAEQVSDRPRTYPSGGPRGQRIARRATANRAGSHGVCEPDSNPADSRPARALSNASTSTPTERNNPPRPPPTTPAPH